MKAISRILFTSAMLLVLSMFTRAQPSDDHQKRMEEYRAMKIAYFTENLGLTSQEAEKFWPLYNKYEQDKAELRKNRMVRSKEFAEKADQLGNHQQAHREPEKGIAAGNPVQRRPEKNTAGKKDHDAVYHRGTVQGVHVEAAKGAQGRSRPQKGS